jgi:hypothetical protein
MGHFPLFSQNKPEAPGLSDPNSFTWILLPDLQTYQKFGRNQALFQLMTDWIIDQKENLNIKMVLCTGDLVEQDNLLVPDGKNGDQPSVKQWEAVRRGFSKLNNNIPYILCTGNHDYGIKSAENRYSQFNSYFPPQGNPLTQNLLVEMAPNEQGIKTLENACYQWKSPLGQSFLIFSLEFAPRTEILSWAKQLAANPRYKDYIGVVLTHSYINSKGKLTHLEKYPLSNANYGEEIWKDLVQPSNNIQFVLSGHIADSESHAGQVGFRTDKNMAGINVHQMLFNAQREGGGWHGNGGDGWLRILEFLPDKKTVKVSTFSPLFWISPSTRSLAQRTEGFDQYFISYH